MSEPILRHPPSVGTDVSNVALGSHLVGPLFRSARDAMVIFDLVHQRIVECNPAAVQLFGYSRAEVQDVRLADLLSEPSVDQIASKIQQFVDNGMRAFDDDEPVVELETRNKGGDQLWIEVSGTPVSPGRSSYMTLIIRDCTWRKNLEREQTNLLKEMHEHSRRVAELSRSKDEFTAMIAHEIGNPVVAIRALAEIMGGDSMSNDQRIELASAIRSEADMVLRLIDDMRDIVNLDQGRFAVQPEIVDLNTIVQDAVQSAKILLSHHLEISPLPEVKVWADASRIGQVLRNLLTNAAKYTPSGTTVKITMERTDTGRIRLLVTDHGPGIAAEDLGRIFSKFERGSNIHQGSPIGAGLGLYVSRHIVEAHGGELVVDSEPGEYTTFRFCLEEVGG